MKVVATHKTRGTEYVYAKPGANPDYYIVSTLRGWPSKWLIAKSDLKMEEPGVELSPAKKEQNFEWQFGDNPSSITFCFYEEKTLLNRFKWWFSTKFFLPGSYKWKI